MKKIFKKLKLRDLLFFIIGGVVIGTIGITATTYVLESSEIQYKDNKSVQQAIEELYILAQNGGSGSTQILPIGDVSVKSLTVKISYTGTYNDVKCLYGTDENYGNKGSTSDNICTFMGTDGNQTLYYKIIASNDDGKIYENSGSTTTGTETNVIVTDIPTGTKAIIYLDPTDLSATCNESNSTIGSGTSGCMKWYAFKEDSSSYTMILDHKTSSAAWNSSGGSKMKEVQTELDNLVTGSGWKVIPRLITASEVAKIDGVTSSNTEHIYYEIALSLSWLYQDSKYWTSSYSSDTAGAWFVGYYSGGRAYMNEHTMYKGESEIYPSTKLGVRPVITISKSSL